MSEWKCVHVRACAVQELGSKGSEVDDYLELEFDREGEERHFEGRLEGDKVQCIMIR